MAKLSGKDLMSRATESSGRRLIGVSSIVILVKAYDVDLGDLSILGLTLPPQLFDVIATAMIAYYVYNLAINWGGDLAAFKLWFSEAQIWSEFKTNIKLGGGFLGGGQRLLIQLFELEHKDSWPENFDDLDEQLRRDYEEYKTNIELFIARLEAAGSNLKSLSRFARFYIWFQSFLFPLAFAIAAGLLLLI